MSCSSGKSIYTTRSKAKNHVKKCKQHGHGLMRVYRCDRCLNWHLTSSRNNTLSIAYERDRRQT